MRNRAAWVIVMLWCAAAVVAQPAPAIITAENVRHLRPTDRLDFAALPAEFGTILTGWFALNPSGERFALLNTDGSFITATTAGAEQLHPPLGSTASRGVDAIVQPSADGDIFLYDDGGQYDVLYADGPRLRFRSQSRPQTLWQDDSNLYIELMPARILRLPRTPDQQMTATQRFIRAREADYVQIPYAPADDPTAIVRIGRISPPHVVTSDEVGRVRLWDIQQAGLLAEARTSTQEPAVFGSLNAHATHLAWRDAQSKYLYLLDFMTGEDRPIAALNGAYVQWFFVSADASVILGINLDAAPVVVAWDTATGEQIILGEYRACGRPQPDMARLSHDGTTLVIGCDTGLEVWRIQPSG